MRPASLVTVLFAAAVLPACNPPQPEVPDAPPSPQAVVAPTAIPDANTTAPPAHVPRPLDRTPATPDLPPLGTDNRVWKDAAQRGVAFRAAGQEPGWYLEVDGGDASRLHAVLDYGERIVDIASLERTDGEGYRGTTDDGLEVVVRTSEGPCFDGMSGHRFPTKVEFSIGDQAYAGCGAYL